MLIYALIPLTIRARSAIFSLLAFKRICLIELIGRNAAISCYADHFGFLFRFHYLPSQVSYLCKRSSSTRKDFGTIRRADQLSPCYLFSRFKHSSYCFWLRKPFSLSIRKIDYFISFSASLPTVICSALSVNTILVFTIIT